MIVLGVQSGFPARVAGLPPGDIVTKVDQQPIDDLATLKQIYANFVAKPDTLLVEALRDRRISLYVLKP